MHCCEDCDDHLDIPAGAIEVNAVYEITQRFPFISCQEKRNNDYRVVCVKEYIVRKYHKFTKHVKIVSHFTSDVDEQHIGLRVRYSTDNEHYKEAMLLNDSAENCLLPDVYFTVRKNVITIFSTHFTVFIVEEERPAYKKIFSRPKCLKQRFVDLHSFAHLSVNYEERSIMLHVYVLDIQHKKYKDVKRSIGAYEGKCGKNSISEAKSWLTCPIS